MPGNRSDYGTEQTDRAVKRVERRLSSVYRQAQRDIDDKLKDWQERHKKRDARYRQMVAAGKMSKEDYRAWLRGQVFQEKQWQARRDEIDNILLNADRAAQNIVNEGKLGVFAANANYMGYALERDSNIDTGFVLYSEGTVARLIEDDPQILPKPAPGVQKDLAFPYYNKLMSSAITQGIVQGETISEIAGRVARTTGESSYKSAMRNARTAYTGAQNAGRIEGLHQAQRLGIKVKKKWLAILDSRTRDTHRDLDGQIQEVDDPFKSDLGEIMFPGDPTAKPALTYNCRCTLTYEYPDYPSTMPRRDAENGQIVADMTYREWEALKKEGTSGAAQKQDAKPAPTKKEVVEQHAKERRIYSKSGGMIYNAALGNDIELRENERYQDDAGAWQSRVNVTGSFTVQENTDDTTAVIYVLPNGKKSFGAWDETQNTIMTGGRVAVNTNTGNNMTRDKVAEMIQNEIATLGGIREDGVFYRATSSKKEAEYIRKGIIRPSANHMTGKKEDGLSVWEISKYPSDILEKVSGDVIGIGSDGEPLLDVKTVKLLEADVNDQYNDMMKRGRKRFLEIYGWTEKQLDSALNGSANIRR